MNKLVLALIVVVVAAYAYHEYREDNYGHRPVVTDTAHHNAQMNECARLALEKHPGAVVETEVEMEDGKLITDKNDMIDCDFLKSVQVVVLQLLGQIFGPIPIEQWIFLKMG